MSHNGLSEQNGATGATSDVTEPGVSDRSRFQTSPLGTQLRQSTRPNPTAICKVLARFPIKLPVSFKSNAGESHTETENISANGVLFRVDAEMPVGAPLDFTISLPAAILGAGADVQVDCRGRVVRSVAEDGRRGVGVVIDEYRFERQLKAALRKANGEHSGHDRRHRADPGVTAAMASSFA